MKTRRLACTATTALTAVVVLSTAQAATGPTRTSYRDCLKHANTTLAMDQCIKTERQRLAPLIAAAYAKLANDSSQPARHVRQLARAERAWRGYKSRDCGYAGAFYSGGTLQPIAEGECLVDREQERLRELRQYEKVLAG